MPKYQLCEVVRNGNKKSYKPVSEAALPLQAARRVWQSQLINSFFAGKPLELRPQKVKKLEAA